MVKALSSISLSCRTSVKKNWVWDRARQYAYQYPLEGLGSLLCIRQPSWVSGLAGRLTVPVALKCRIHCCPKGSLPNTPTQSEGAIRNCDAMHASRWKAGLDPLQSKCTPPWTPPLLRRVGVGRGLRASHCWCKCPGAVFATISTWEMLVIKVTHISESEKMETTQETRGASGPCQDT